MYTVYFLKKSFLPPPSLESHFLKLKTILLQLFQVKSKSSVWNLTIWNRKKEVYSCRDHYKETDEHILHSRL